MRYVWFALWLGLTAGGYTALIIGAYALWRWIALGESTWGRAR